MAGQSIYTQVLAELQKNKNHDSSIKRCTSIINELEQIINKRIIAYFSSDIGADNHSMINDQDAFIIENILSVKSDKKDLVLILNSGGGSALSAERIIEVCKSYCLGKNDKCNFIIIIPKKAKSAATMVALAADKIYLRNTAELGPVDPQFIVVDKSGNRQIDPAYLYIDAIENIFDLEPKSFIKNPFCKKNDKKLLSNLPDEIKLKIIDQCNYSMYVSAKNELGLSGSIIEKISNEKINKYSGISKDDFNIFIDPHITKAHGRLINFADLKNNGLYKEKVIDTLQNLFEKDKEKYMSFDLLLWELYVRKHLLVNDPGHKIVKTIEDSEEFFINLGIKIGQTK